MTVGVGCRCGCGIGTGSGGGTVSLLSGGGCGGFFQNGREVRIERFDSS